ncbi:MAG TPA: hypothetical protein VGH63_18770 [Polyangia bacterium]
MRGARRETSEGGARGFRGFTRVGRGFAESTAERFGVRVVFVFAVRVVVDGADVRVGGHGFGWNFEASGGGFAAERGHARFRRAVFAAREAQLHDELRHARLRIDRDAHAVDLRLPSPARFEVFDLEPTPDFEELEVRPDLHFLAASLAHARFHRRTEAIDVQAHARADFGFRIVDRGFVLICRRSAVAQVAQRAHAARIERGEFDAEFAAARALSAPSHSTLDHDFAPGVFEAAHERRAVLRQIGRAKVHPARAHVDRFGLERRNAGLVAAHFDQGFDPHAPRALGATFLDFGHGCLRRERSQRGQIPAFRPE